jgi:hypothetical protein
MHAHSRPSKVFLAPVSATTHIPSGVVTPHVLGGLLERLREAVRVEPADERIDGTGDVYLDPAYNGRYTAERELKRLAEAESADEDQDHGQDL